MATNLEGKLALVTGGSRGIGKAIVETLARAGCRVVFTYNHSKRQAEDVAKQSKATAVKLDARSVEEIRERILQIYSEYSYFDLLVNNAGVYHRNAFLETTEEIWDETLDTNLKGAYFTTKYAVENMQPTGMVINIASDAGFKRKGIEYGISKQGLIYLTKVLAKVLVPKINCVCPSYTDTDMAIWVGNPESKKEIEATHGKVNTPEEVATAVLSLAKSDSTGRIIVVKNGQVSDYQPEF